MGSVIHMADKRPNRGCGAPGVPGGYVGYSEPIPIRGSRKYVLPWRLVFIDKWELAGRHRPYSRGL